MGGDEKRSWSNVLHGCFATEHFLLLRLSVFLALALGRPSGASYESKHGTRSMNAIKCIGAQGNEDPSHVVMHLMCYIFI